MVKLPIYLNLRNDWKSVFWETVHSRLNWKIMRKTKKLTGEIFARWSNPGAAQNKSLTVNKIRETLETELNLPTEQIAEEHDKNGSQKVGGRE